MKTLKIASRFAAMVLTGTLLSACTAVQTGQTAAESAAATPAYYPAQGAVSAADPRAQAAGEAMLAQGGSASDAAIATMLALSVVEPQSSGIGGGGFMIRGTSGGEVISFDGRETAPSGAVPEWFMGADGELLGYRESVLSGLSIGVPGNIAMAAKVHGQHGKLAWAALFEPAIKLADEGFVMNRRLNASLDGSLERAGRTPEARALFFDAQGNPKPVGTLIRNPAMAKTLRAIAAKGAEAFYGADAAEKLAQAVKADTPRSGAMTREDVMGYESKSRDAVCGMYREYRICGMGPPSSGGVAVLQILGQLERFDLSALGPDSAVTWHLFLESQRLAYADRELYLADSDFVSVPVNGLLNADYIAGRSALISADKAMDSAAPGTPPGFTAARADGDEPAENGTSHLAAIDSAGTMVSYTSTVEGPFGSGLFHGGFYLNNELTDFSRSPVADGKPVANRVEGGKRPRSSMAPSVIYDPQGRPMAAIGAAGGSTIPVQTARAIIGIIDFGMELEYALGLPLLMAYGDNVLIEEGTWFETRVDEFKALGHTKIGARSPPLKAGGIVWDDGKWVAARDPRLNGMLETTP